MFVYIHWFLKTILILDYFLVNRRIGNQEYLMGCASFNEKFKSVKIFKGCDTRLQCFLEK